MHLDPAMPALVAAVLAILLVGLVTRALKQPSVVGYLVAGVLLGPDVLGLIKDEVTLSRLGAVGVMLLLFFAGMDVSPRRLLEGWRVAVIGTAAQILVSIGCVWLLGAWLGWPFQRIILIGFVISLSSTAVVLRILEDWGELGTQVGQNVLGILLVQDVAVVPMLIIIGIFGGEPPGAVTLTLQIVGGVAIVALMAWLAVKGTVSLPFSRLLRKSHEMEVFAALATCFGLALVTGLLGLSSALGAFVAGILVGVGRESQWVHTRLESFRVVFVAVFFVSVGMMLDLDFLRENWVKVAILVAAALLTNTFINAVLLRLLGCTWRGSMYAGAFLSQIGEFSFVLALVGHQSGIITELGYQLALTVIACSLAVSPLWITMFRSAGIPGHSDVP